MGESKINLGERWQKALDRFIEIGYFDGSPDDGEEVRAFFSHLEKGGVNVIPRSVLWRPDDDGDGNDISYYVFHWETCLILLDLDGSCQFGSYPGPDDHGLTSQSEILSHLEENLEMYHLI